MFSIFDILDDLTRDELPLFPLAIFRVLLGTLVVIDAFTYFLGRRAWLSEHGVLPLSTWRSSPGWKALSIFKLIGVSDWAIAVVPVVLLVSGTLLVVGLWTHLVAATSFVLLVSLHHRNRHVTYGGDCVMRIMLFLICFSPAGDCLAVDQLIRDGSISADSLGPSWSIRLMQLQVACIYFYTCRHKSSKRAWQNGSAVCYALRNPAFRHFPLPSWARGRAFSRIATPLTLVFEGVLPFALLDRDLAAPAVGAGIAFHLLLGYGLRLYLFSPVMISCLFLFLAIPAGKPEISTALNQPAFSFLPLVWVVAAGAMLAWDDPGRGATRVWIRESVVGKVVRWLGLDHGWALFSGNPPASTHYVVRVVTMTVVGRVMCHQWSDTGIELVAADVPLARSVRRRKFEEALSRHAFLGYGFGEYVRNLSRLNGSVVELVVVIERIRSDDLPFDPARGRGGVIYAWSSDEPQYDLACGDGLDYERAVLAWNASYGIADDVAVEAAFVAAVCEAEASRSVAAGPAMQRLAASVAAWSQKDDGLCSRLKNFASEHLSPASAEVLVGLLVQRESEPNKGCQRAAWLPWNSESCPDEAAAAADVGHCESERSDAGRPAVPTESAMARDSQPELLLRSAR